MEIGEEHKCSRGWTVAMAGLGMNLALGILYTWSVISKAIPADWQWSEAQKSLPYSIACLVFSLIMVLAGRLQDRLGPRWVATAGGLLVGLGMVAASLTTSSLGYVLGFGVLSASGIGFAYASTTPSAVKWFPAAQTGRIAGLVVSGFGLASVYAAPLARWLIAAYGLPTAMFALGVAFLIVVTGLAQFLQSPPPGYVPPGAAMALMAASPMKKEDFTPTEMLATPQFYLLWFMYACAAGAGLMVIAKLDFIGKQQAGIDPGFVLVAALALGNGAGRIVAGIVSDKVGRQRTLRGCFVFQAILVLLLSTATEGTPHASLPVLALISALIGANYGANLTLFPSATKDYYGPKNMGVNYGLVYTSWGFGGFLLALVAGRLYDLYNTFAYAYYGAAVLLALAAATTFALRPPAHLKTASPAVVESEPL